MLSLRYERINKSNLFEARAEINQLIEFSLKISYRNSCGHLGFELLTEPHP